MLNKSQLIECEDCDGQHKGVVVAVFGKFYGVAWEDRNENFRQPGNTDPQYPAEFLEQHTSHLVSVSELAIRPRS